VLTKDHTVLPVTHTFIHKWNEPYLPLLHPLLQSVIALWPVLIFCPAEGRRLNWPDWLITNRCGLLTHIRGEHWHHLANTIEPPMCRGDTTRCQITLTACFLYFCSKGELLIKVSIDSMFDVDSIVSNVLQ